MEANKILHVISGLNSGGAENALYKISRKLTQSHGVTIYIVSLSKTEFYLNRLMACGIKVFFIDVKEVGLIRAGIELSKIIKSLDPDVIQTWMVHADLFAGIVCKIVGYNNLYWGIRTTDYSVEKSKTRFLHNFAKYLSYIVPKKIVCVANAAKNSHIKNGFDSSKMVVIGNGFDFDELNNSIGGGKNVRSTYNIKKSEILIGCVGRFDYSKDQYNFILAASILKKMGYDCKYIIIGRGIKSQIIKLYLDNNKLVNDIILVDEVSNVPDYLDALDIFVLPSRSEGFPNILGEAMAMSVPCVVTDVGDSGELMGDRNYVVPKENSKELALAIEKLINLPKNELYYQGEKMKNRVMNNYSIEKVAVSYLNLYNTKY